VLHQAVRAVSKKRPKPPLHAMLDIAFKFWCPGETLDTYLSLTKNLKV
jgi:hypothetical protein